MHRPCWHETSVVLVGLGGRPPNSGEGGDESRSGLPNHGDAGGLWCP